MPQNFSASARSFSFLLLRSVTQFWTVSAVEVVLRFGKIFSVEASTFFTMRIAILAVGGFYDTAKRPEVFLLIFTAGRTKSGIFLFEASIATPRKVFRVEHEIQLWHFGHFGNGRFWIVDWSKIVIHNLSNLHYLIYTFAKIVSSLFFNFFVFFRTFFRAVFPCNFRAIPLAGEWKFFSIFCIFCLTSFPFLAILRLW